jgi:hypothetical protein
MQGALPACTCDVPATTRLLFAFSDCILVINFLVKEKRLLSLFCFEWQNSDAAKIMHTKCLTPLILVMVMANFSLPMFVISYFCAVMITIYMLDLVSGRLVVFCWGADGQ